MFCCTVACIYFSVGQKISSTTPGVKGVDIDGEGVINGVNVYEFSLDSLRDEEKPWRKPGKTS